MKVRKSTRKWKDGSYSASVEAYFSLWDDSTGTYQTQAAVTKPLKFKAHKRHRFNDPLLPPVAYKEAPFGLEIALVRVKEEDGDLLKYLNFVANISTACFGQSLAQANSISTVIRSGIQSIAGKDKADMVSFSSRLNDEVRLGNYVIYDDEIGKYTDASKFNIKPVASPEDVALFYGEEEVGDDLSYAIIKVEKLDKIPNWKSIPSIFEAYRDIAKDEQKQEALKRFERLLKKSPFLIQKDADRIFQEVQREFVETTSKSP